MIAPPRKATASASFSPVRAASAVRTFERTETFMPMKPASPDSTAPTANPAAVVQERNSADDDQQDDADDADRRVLTIEIGLRALLDRGGDLLHALVAGRLFHDPADRPAAVDERGDRADEREDKCG